MLIDQNRIAVGIHDHKTRRTGRFFIRFGLERDSLYFELALKITNVRKCIEFLGVAVPAGIKSEDVLFEHSLKHPNRVIPVFENQPILRRVSREHLEPEFS
jgi:hypothetical protein